MVVVLGVWRGSDKWGRPLALAGRMLEMEHSLPKKKKKIAGSGTSRYLGRSGDVQVQRGLRSNAVFVCGEQKKRNRVNATRQSQLSLSLSLFSLLVANKP